MLQVEKLIEPYAWARNGPSPFPLQLRVYPEAETLFELKEGEVSHLLTFTRGPNGRAQHFNLTLNQEQAEKIGEKMLRSGRRHGPRAVSPW